MFKNPLRPEISALTAYHVQPAEGVIKLDAMENPYAFPDALRAELELGLAKVALNRYPSAGATELKAAIRTAMKIPANYEILLGNGSDEIIQMIAMACAKPGSALLSIEPAFVMFKMIATFCNMRYVGVPLNEDFSLDLKATLAAIEHEKPAVTFIAYPNNPTGNLFDRTSIRRIAAAAMGVDGLVVIDEAYFAFSSETWLAEIGDFPNVVLMRTVSKLGLAGLRLGMLIGPRLWINEFDKVRLPYNINAYTQAAATFAMQHYDAFTQQAQALTRERVRLNQLFASMPGLTAYPSDANFILVRVANAQKTFDALLARKILVKNTSTSHPLLANTLRITIGSPDENNALIVALNAIQSEALVTVRAAS
jgi:histidinol-phosphate aminotransferase